MTLKYSLKTRLDLELDIKMTRLRTRYFFKQYMLEFGEL